MGFPDALHHAAGSAAYPWLGIPARHTLKRTRKFLRIIERAIPVSESLIRPLYQLAVKLSNRRQTRSGMWGTDSAFIAVTTQVGCRCACRYCPQEQFVSAYARRRTRELPPVSGVKVDHQCMSLDSFQWFLERIPRQATINFVGFSEPCLNAHWLEMVLAAYQRGHRLRLMTTMAGMSPEDIARLSPIPFQGVRIHLADQQPLDRISVDERMLQTLDAIVDLGFSNLAYHRHSEDAHPELVQRLGRFQIHREETHNRAGNLSTAGLVSVSRRLRGHIRCGYDPRSDDLNHNILLPNGDLVLCSMDWGLDHIIGNLVQSDLAEIYRSEPYLTLKGGLRDESVDLLCRYCTMAVTRDSGGFENSGEGG